jgi:hypothetical protein
MEGYAVAFPSIATKQIRQEPPTAISLAKQLSELRTKTADELMGNLGCLPTTAPKFAENEISMKQLLACCAGLKRIYATLEEAFENLNKTTTAEMRISGSRLMNLYSICFLQMISNDTENCTSERKRLKKINGESDITEQEIEKFSQSNDGKQIIQLKGYLHHLNTSSLPIELEIEMKKVWGSLLDKKAKEKKCLAFDAKCEREFKQECLKNRPNLEEELLTHLKSKTIFFNIRPNGVWGGNNCFFASIGQTKDALEKLIAIFGLTSTSPNGESWEKHWPEGGPLLRKALFTFFESEKDQDLVNEMCFKEADQPTQETIVKKI